MIDIPIDSCTFRMTNGHMSTKWTTTINTRWEATQWVMAW